MSRNILHQPTTTKTGKSILPTGLNGDAKFHKEKDKED